MVESIWDTREKAKEIFEDIRSINKLHGDMGLWEYLKRNKKPVVLSVECIPFSINMTGKPPMGNPLEQNIVAGVIEEVIGDFIVFEIEADDEKKGLIFLNTNHIVMASFEQ